MKIHSSIIKIAHRIVDDEINSKEKLSRLLAKLQDYGFGGVEFDIRQTNDQQFVVFHDARFPQLRHLIRKYSLSELLKEAKEKNFSFLTLGEVLKIIPSSFWVQVDIKDKIINVELLVKALQQSQSLNRIIVSSFYPHTILQLSRHNIKQRWFLVNISIKRNPIHIFYAIMPLIFALKCQATGIAAHQCLVSKNLLLKAHKAGLTAATWTVNNFKTMKHLEKYKLDYIIVDYRIYKIKKGE